MQWQATLGWHPLIGLPTTKMMKFAGRYFRKVRTNSLKVGWTGFQSMSLAHAGLGKWSMSSWKNSRLARSPRNRATWRQADDKGLANTLERREIHKIATTEIVQTKPFQLMQSQKLNLRKRDRQAFSIPWKRKWQKIIHLSSNWQILLSLVHRKSWLSRIKFTQFWRQ